MDWIEEGLPVGLRRRKTPSPMPAKQEHQRPATPWQKLQGMLKDNVRDGFRIVGDGLGGFYPVYPESWSIEMRSEAQALFNQSLDDLEEFATRFPKT
ncbi:hypothetical protein [Pseudodesulfovibrio indicus]|uniref:hypothetical protein n=1 Tax=Pseudodesulfovibrio indicus TaxID=1716143 RepID=UPI00292D986C|nr:hypothetical protein [Pseudodesulfovibrio indicus]